MKQFYLLLFYIAMASCNTLANKTKERPDFMAAGIVTGGQTDACKGYGVEIEDDTALYRCYSFPGSTYADTTKFPLRILFNYKAAGNCGDIKVITITEMQPRYRDHYGSTTE